MSEDVMSLELLQLHLRQARTLKGLLDALLPKWRVVLVSEPCLRYPALVHHKDGGYYTNRQLFKDEAEAKGKLPKEAFVSLLTEWGVLTP